MAVEEMLTATYMLGRAIATVTFPGMYRIYDFHSPKAPKLQNAKKLTFFSQEDDSDDGDDEKDCVGIAPDPCQYEDMFKVTVGDDIIYLENPIEVNDAGWTPLHTCCMSFLTVSAGQQLIDETLRLGGSLDVKTVHGPGNFNSGWTPLHMAAAYGIEPLVSRLVDEGADPNTFDAHEYTPLLEACHRGFAQIASTLVSGRANLTHTPSMAAAGQSSFSRAPPQAALAEAARSGFNPIVQMLVNAGAPKDQCNSLGWTALHEACFYNRIEVVKILMINGANAGIRTKSGALPYHFAGLSMIRNMLKDMGGPDAVPEDEDMIDMAKVMKELTVSGATTASMSSDMNQRVQPDSKQTTQTHRTPVKKTPQTQKGTPALAPAKTKSTPSRPRDLEVDDSADETAIMHSGPMLGELPSLTSKRSSPGKPFEAKASSPGKTKKNRRRRAEAPKDIPPEYLCALCNKLMSDPLRSAYGNYFDRTVIMKWIKDQGKICPVTGCPLAETDLQPDDKLKGEIQQWILHRSSGGDLDETHETEASSPIHGSPMKQAKTASTVQTEDIYDF